MDTTTSMVMSETNAFKESRQIARTLGKDGEALLHWLEASGPFLKLAGVSKEASEVVHAYRTTRDVAALSGSGIARDAYERMRGKLTTLLNSGAVEQELRDVIELEVRRADALITEAGKWPERPAVSPKFPQIEMTQERADLLHAWSQRMKGEGLTADVRAAYSQLLARIKADDKAWASIAEIALDRAGRVKEQFPTITRATYESNSAAKELIERSYMVHGKGEMFEPFARNSEPVKEAINGEVRAATHTAAARGGGFKSQLSVGELRLGTVDKTGKVTEWKKFADTGVLITADKTEAQAAVAAAGASQMEVHGIAQPSALVEFKSEAGISDIPNQQERALPRMVERWERGEPVYVSFTAFDENGKTVEKIYLLQPPDSKVGLSYYGVGTSNAFIAERDILATQGALVKNINVDVSNDTMRNLWYEIFWTAFDSLK